MAVQGGAGALTRYIHSPTSSPKQTTDYAHILTCDGQAYSFASSNQLDCCELHQSWTSFRRSARTSGKIIGTLRVYVYPGPAPNELRSVHCAITGMELMYSPILDSANFTPFAARTQQLIREQLGQVEDKTQLPDEYIELEKRVDALKLVHQKLLQVTYVAFYINLAVIC